MELLERIWEAIGTFFSGTLKGFEQLVTSMFGSSNARQVKKMQSQVDRINELEPKYEAMSDAELARQTVLFRQRLADGETLEDILPEAFAVCREGGKRYLNMRHYDVQLIGGMVLHSGAIAEMVTGEGKTLVATLPTYLNAIDRKGVHVVTVNDYLARRDMEWMAPLYMGLGLTVDAIYSNMSPADRQKAYACDITYGTNNEFGFDYLRDNMRPAARDDERYEKRLQQAQGPLNYAVIDEVDNILIDEARTPLIISGPANHDARKYKEADSIARKLKKEEHFVVNEKDHSAHMTDDGVRHAEKLAGVESFYTAGNMEWPHMLDNALKAHHLYQKDVNYVVEEGKVVIIDEFTGRKMEGRQWSDGLHQAVEAKEGVKIKEETQTLATITLQNFFKLYKKISGMTGTAMTEANEFYKIYELDVVAIPTNREMQRITFPDAIYRTEREKYEAVADEIERFIKWDVIELKDREVWGKILKEQDSTIEFRAKGHNKTEVYPRDEIRHIQRAGRPILVGTVSIEKSERLSKLLDKRGIKHEVLNAKQHKREADIVAQAGRIGMVTIATNMAGRGTDIVLGGNPETKAWAQLQHEYENRLEVPHDVWENLVKEIQVQDDMKAEGERVKALGGLHVIGTERHESRRIDLQLRGRCGRQGDPGSSRFCLSLEDDLMRIFAGDWVKSVLDRLGMQEGEAIESKMVTRRVEAAQKKVEERHFDVRKNLLEYDEVMDEQRKRVYNYRQQILNGANCRDLIAETIQEQVDHYVDLFLDRDYGVDTFAAFAGSKLSTKLEARMFRGLDFPEADKEAHDFAQRNAESEIFSLIEENLPEDAPDEWNWEALTRVANTRWELSLRDRDLKKLPQEQLAEFLIEKAHAAIDRVDLSEAKNTLDEDYGFKSAKAWAEGKFGVAVDLELLKSQDAAEAKKTICKLAETAYDQKEAEYPVMAGMYRFVNPSGSQSRIDKDGLVEWATRRFETPVGLEELRNKQRDEIRSLLLEKSKRHHSQADSVREQVQDKIESLFNGSDSETTLKTVTGGNGELDSLQDWLNKQLELDISPDELAKTRREELQRRLTTAVEDRFNPEMRRMERSLLLQIVDSAWKDHLLAMDHLRSSIGLVGYAQLDAKVEYKREGMNMFDDMWRGVGERSTDLIFRMEMLDEGFVGSTWVDATASKAQVNSEIGKQQQEAIEGSGGGGDESVVEQIRRRERVGRNDPCPCGSGKKYKNCHYGS